MGFLFQILMQPLLNLTQKFSLRYVFVNAKNCNAKKTVQHYTTMAC